MQQPQYPNSGYGPPAIIHGGTSGYGTMGQADAYSQPYGAAYGALAPEGQAHAVASSATIPPRNAYSADHTHAYHPVDPTHAQHYSHSTYTGGPANSTSLPQSDPHAGSSAPYYGAAFSDHSNPNQEGFSNLAQSNNYVVPSPAAYGYAPANESGQPPAYESLDSFARPTASQTFAEGPSSTGGGPAAYGDHSANVGATLPAYLQGEVGYGHSYTGHTDSGAYTGYDRGHGSAHQSSPYDGQQAAVPATAPYSSMHGQHVGASQPPSYLNTQPQSSNPSHNSIQAGLSSLNLGNPVKQPNYLERADSGGSNLISFKSNYGGTIRYEAPRTNSSRPETGGYGRSNPSSELIDIVQGPGSASGNCSYRSGRAQPADTVEGEGGIQRYKVRLMPEESGSGAPQQVLCQVALDGVRLFNADGKTTLRIYPLESITRWAVQQPTVFTFWAKTSVDVEQRAVKLSSNEGTTTAILDTLTAACVQLGEMIGGKESGGSQAPTSASVSAASTDNAKPKGMSIVEWVTKKPVVEEKQHWIPDESANKCSSCGTSFTAFNRRHHCRNCGEVFCDACTKGRIALTSEDGAPQVRVCDRCLAEVTHRLQNVQPAKTAAAPPVRSHEDLAKKLQAELDRKKPAPVSAASGGGGQTTVLTCKSCGSVSLGSAGNTRCSACGSDANKAPSTSSSRSAAGGSRQSSWSTEGPPHLWEQQQSKSGERTRQVACPTCTVHLTVKIPSHGTETVECGVCQHPFLVAA